MTRFDSHLRKRLQKETPRMPAGMAARFDDTLSTLEKPPARHSAAFRILRLAAVVLALVLFVLPNINPTIAYAMQEIPILGDLISVFTVYKLEESNEYHYQDVQIPQIEATDDGNSAIDYINADVEALANAAIAEYEATVEKFPDAHTGLLIDYDVITNTRDWFTIRLMVFREAGSSSVQYYFYHIDKQKGELVQLSDLFREDMTIGRFSATKSEPGCVSKWRITPIWSTGWTMATARILSLIRSTKIRISILIPTEIW